MDKDVSETSVKTMCDKLILAGCEKVSYILDKYKYLDVKDSPIDKGLDIWCKLFEESIIVGK